MGFFYALAQITGAVLGFGLLTVLTPEKYISLGSGFCMNLPNESLSNGSIFVLEFCLTSALILICCGIWDPRNIHGEDTAAIKIGKNANQR